jgi:CRP/FNR family cyclic AMP-dependent transcriptional regulator
MSIKPLDSIVAEHPLFADLDPDLLALVTGCAKNVRFDDGDALFSEGDPADTFYLIREGQVALDIFVPNHGAVTIETVDSGEVVGWSWLIEPHRAHFDARAVGQVRALEFDGACLRAKSEEDCRVGYALYSRFAPLLVDRLEATQLRLLDLYGRIG